MEKQQKTVPQNTTVFGTQQITLYGILAVIAAMVMSNWGRIFNYGRINVTTPDDPTAINKKYTNAESVVTANGPKGVTNITNVETFVAYCAKKLSNPTISLLVRLVTGKSRINFQETFDHFVAQGYTGVTLLRVFWNFATFTINEHLAALKSAVVIAYVNNVKATQMANGVLMLTIKGKTPLTAYQALAVETLLLRTYGNSKCVITFEIPGLIGLTPFFGNTEVANQFTKEMLAQYNDVEAQYSETTKWQVSGNVLFINGETSIPVSQRTSVLNGTINATLEAIGPFSTETNQVFAA